MDVTQLPYCQFLGLKEIAINGRPAIGLDPQPHHMNHVGSVHAAVLFAVGETAAAQAMVKAFPDLVGSVGVVLRSADVKHHKPGSGSVHGVGSIDEQAAVAFRSRLERRGAAKLDVTAFVRDADDELLSGRYYWFVTSNLPSATNRQDQDTE